MLPARAVKARAGFVFSEGVGWVMRVGCFLARMANNTPCGRAHRAHPLGVLPGFLFRMAHAMRSIAGPAGVTRTPPA